MTQDYIEYRGGYKYQLASDYRIDTIIKPAEDIDTKFIKLTTAGELTVVTGYAWDGPSGPVVDRKENMRASLVHDALYQLMRQRKLTAKDYKDKADRLFQKICIEDGISKKTAGIYYYGLKVGGKPATKPEHQKKIHRAP